MQPRRVCVNLTAVILVTTILASAQPGDAPPDTLSCIAVRSEPIHYDRRSMVDVALTNNCRDDITALAVGLSDRAASQPVRAVETTDLLNLLTFPEPRTTINPYNPRDVFRRGHTIRWRLPVPDMTPNYLGEPSVTAAVFMGRTALGDNKIIGSILAGRKETFEALASARLQLTHIRDRAEAKSAFRDLLDSPPQSGSSAKGRARQELNEVEKYAQLAPAEEAFQTYLASKRQHLDFAIGLFRHHSELRTALPSAITQWNRRAASGSGNKKLGRPPPPYSISRINDTFTINSP